MFRSSNPALNDKRFANFDLTDAGRRSDNVMTLTGAINKTTMLLVMLMLAAGYTWYMATSAGEGITDPAEQLKTISNAAFPWIIGGVIVGLIVGIVTALSPKISPFTAPLYALAEGVFLGALSCVLNNLYEGLAIQAIGATFGVFAVMLVLYMTRIIQPTRKFAIAVMAATGGVMVFYLIEILLEFFGMGSGLLAFNNGGMLSIGVSVVIVAIAALNLIMDFVFIETQAQRGAPKYMEWYAGFGLLVTLVWLYLEILRLLAKLQSRN